MFIKLTRMDGSPIWINGASIVTIEARKSGGAVVVPVGDGLDYDVREEPEAVFKLLGEKPVEPKAPRTRKTKAATETAADSAPGEAKDVAAKDESAAQAAEAAPADDAPAGKAKARARTTKKATKAAAAKEAGAPAPAQSPAQPQVSGEEAFTRALVGAVEKTPLDLDDASVARLRKLAPRTIKKLQNTLLAQFKTADASVTTKALADSGIITVGPDDRLTWNAAL